MRAAWWWIDRWRKSTAYICMNLEEQAMYRNLLDAVWLFDGRPIPDDPKTLITASGGDAEAWDRSGVKVLRWMRRVEGGWVNDTASEVMKETKALSRSRSKAGKKGATARWRRGSNGNGKSDDNEIASDIATTAANSDTKASHPSPSPSPSPDVSNRSK